MVPAKPALDRHQTGRGRRFVESKKRLAAGRGAWLVNPDRLW
jgi:hypothetical protein